MIIVNGKYTNPLIMTEDIEDEAKNQVQNIADHPMFEDSQVRIMPDVHAGAGCVIGFTAQMKETSPVIPNLIGVDIGCGMFTIKLGKQDIDFKALDEFIKSDIPNGFAINDKVKVQLGKDLKGRMKDALKSINKYDKMSYHIHSLGTLGGGNHFIEVAQDKDEDKFLIIHSGSRNFGHSIATYYQKRADIECLKDGIEKSLCYLEGAEAEAYMYHMKTAQDFATVNREAMIFQILSHLDAHETSEYAFETVHNYIDDSYMIRKGAIAAHKDTPILIPLNMRDGSILAIGKGNEEWNNSAPHGAGRSMSRRKAKEVIQLTDFEKQMAGIHTSSVCLATLDEAPEAYKNSESIINSLEPTAELVSILKPVYNFKSH